MADKTPNIAAGSPMGNQQEIEKMLRDYQALQEQMRMYAMQLEQLQVGKADLDRAQKEIESASGRVFINVGGVIVETTKDKAITDVKERAEVSDTRIKSTSKQYKDLQEKEKALKEKIQTVYK